jgi:hypothetical protein
MTDEEFNEFYDSMRGQEEELHIPLLRPSYTYNSWESEVNRLEKLIRRSLDVPNYILNLWLQEITRLRHSRHKPLPRVILREVITENVSRDPGERYTLCTWFNRKIAWNHREWGNVESIIPHNSFDLPSPIYVIQPRD